MNRYDVTIVGGGVAGLYASYIVARAGLKTALIEMKDEEGIGEKTCGDAIGEHHFIELGIDAPVVGFDAEGFYRGVKIVSPDEADIITVDGKGISLNRKNFGVRLYKMAISSGAEAFLNHFFVKPVVDGSWIRGIIAKDKSGKSVTLYSKVVIDASGVPAVVRRSLPMEWWVSEPTSREDYNITYREIVVGDFDVEKEYAYIFLNAEVARGGYWWLFPKGNNVYNIGLGIQWRESTDNPRANYEKFIRKRFHNRIHKVLHGGGGIVPTRRPIPCMVWNGFIVVGDAAATANPVHGGGIGSAMISSMVAAKTIIEALSRSEPSIENLWSYHTDYHRIYGAKQASLDVLRMFLQRMSNSDLNYIFKSRIVSGEDVYNMGYRGELSHSIIDRVSKLVSLVRRPLFVSKLYKLKQYMEKAYQLYKSFPVSTLHYEQWRNEERKLFSEIKEWIEKSF
ncbi:MAG: NAD(P)/FAD-dependent oxidoreductase [Ignisphaera sp.]|nr:NAD(P)/FAD-dependent oxidoreductase [Ignisphaera sp.]